jgi:hypothetical protein
MKVSKILNIWFIVTIALLTFTLVLSVGTSVRLPVFIINITLFIICFFIIKHSLKTRGESYYNEIRLILYILPFSLIAVLVYNLLYYYYTGSYFEFSAIDTFQYHTWGLWMSNLNIMESIHMYLKKYPIDDLGAALVTSLAYGVYPSTVTFNIFNVIAGMVTILAIFRISLNFMERKYAFWASLTYGLSSFVVYIYSTGMKESFFVMCVVLFYLNLIKFWKNKKKAHILLAMLFLGSIYFFRPAVMVILLLSVVCGFIFNSKKNIYSYILIGIIIIFTLVNLPELFKFKVLYESSTKPEVVAVKQNLQPSTFNYLAAYLSAAVGPLPSYQPLIDKEQQAFYATGLGFRVLLSVPFWMAILYIFRRRDGILIAMGSFILIEMFLLASILESFELRLNSPHLPFIYILSFYFISRLNKGKVANHKLIKKITFSSFFILSMLIFVWNLRTVL